MNETKKELLRQALQHTGYLEKKGSGALGSWQKRFFFMLQTEEGYSLLYSEKETDKVPKGEIDLDLVLDIQYKKGKKSFNIVHSGRNFELRAENADLASQWVEQIGIIVQNVFRVKTILMEGYHLNSKKMERVQSMQINSTIGDVKKKEWKKVQTNTLKQIQEIGQFRQSVQNVAQNGQINDSDFQNSDIKNRAISEVSQEDDNPEDIYEQKLKADQKIVELKNEIQKMKDENQKMYSNWKEKVDQNNIKDKKIQELQEQIQNQKNDLEKFEEIKKENESLKQENQEFQDKIQQIQKENEENNNKLQELQQKNNEQKQKIKELAQNNKNIFEQLNEKEDIIQNLQNASIQNNNSQQNEENKENNIQELQNQIKNQKEKIDFYKQEIEKIQNQNLQKQKEFESQIQQLQKDNEYANQQAVEAKVLNANLAWEKDQFQSQSINFKRKLEQLQNQMQQQQN